MIKATKILFLIYYASGVFLLPIGDFSIISDLPQIFHRCKTTEDKDLTVFDFITDHLINFDQIFDKHNNGDEQKPHAPIQNHSYNQTITCQNILPLRVEISPIHFLKLKTNISYIDNFVKSDYTSKILRPPIIS